MIPGRILELCLHGAFQGSLSLSLRFHPGALPAVPSSHGPGCPSPLSHYVFPFPLLSSLFLFFSPSFFLSSPFLYLAFSPSSLPSLDVKHCISYFPHHMTESWMNTRKEEFILPHSFGVWPPWCSHGSSLRHLFTFICSQEEECCFQLAFSSSSCGLDLSP